MTIEMFLKIVQDARAFIEQWGITAETLIAVTVVASICFLFSLREILSWFLRVHALRSDVKGLRKDIAELKELLSARTPAQEVAPEPEMKADEAEEEEPKKKVSEKSAKAFPLDH